MVNLNVSKSKKNNNYKKYNMMIYMIMAIVLLALFFNISYAKSESIESIDVYATITKEGDIKVNQRWKTTTNTGTEYYIPMSNLGNMEITDFHVSDIYGDYENMGTYWNVNASFEQKSRKYGINQNAKGSDFELCFGKSVRGTNMYNVEFTYRNAITSFDDFNAFNIMFINKNMDPAPKNISVTLQMEDGTRLSKENAGIWAFGYNGDIQFKDGKVIAKNTSKFDARSSVIIMMKLNKSLTNTPKYSSNASFESMKARALENSKYEEYKKKGNRVDLFPIFQYLIYAFFIFLSIFKSASNGEKTLLKGKGVDKKKYPYWRDDIYEANILMLHLTQTNNAFKYLLSAQMLKWIKDGVILIQKDKIEVNKLLGTKEVEEDVIHILKQPEFESEFEEDFFRYLILAKGEKDYARKDDLKKLIEEDSEVFSAMITNAKAEARRLANVKGYIDSGRKKFNLTEKGIEEAEKYYGYVRFLDDFTLMAEKESIEVHIWDEILIIATAIGKGEKVLKEFKEIAPDYEFANSIDIYDTWFIVNSYTNSAYSTYSTYTSSSYSGYGGSSSFSGGGGFSGGGSGGGGR